MNLSFWDALPILPALFPGYRHEWERELSTNFEIAFRLALEELLCTLFSNNGSDGVVHNENQCISIDMSKMMNRKNAAAELDDNDETTKTSSQSASIINNDYLSQMIDQTLLQKYHQ